jgi:hypothetical protein
MSTDTLPDTLAEVQRLIDQVSDRLTTIAAAVDRLATTDAPAYWPERMGQLDEVRVGDRAMWDGRWHEVTFMTTAPDNEVCIYTDDGTEPLVSPGRYGVRFQKRADEQQADALHRRDTGGL